MIEGDFHSRSDVFAYYNTWPDPAISIVYAILWNGVDCTVYELNNQLFLTWAGVTGNVSIKDIVTNPFFPEAGKAVVVERFGTWS